MLLLPPRRVTHATLRVLTAELVDLDDLNALADLADGRSRTVSELGAACSSR